MPLTVSAATFTLAGTLLLAVVAIESGGYYLLSFWTRQTDETPFQIGFARAGHAHAGVLVILSLVAQLYVDAAALDGLLGAVARQGVPFAAILMPAGFFLSSTGQGARPRMPWCGWSTSGASRSRRGSWRSASAC